MKIKSSAPGRICLFGEHQDYMTLPVIAAAIDLTITIEGEISPGDEIALSLSDLNRRVQFHSEKIEYTEKREYLKSTVKVLKEKGLFNPRKIDATLRGDIPFQGGTASSSALVVAWVGFLLGASGMPEAGGLTPAEIAELAYLAEVEEFGESGGRMDQYASAIGGIVHLDFYGTKKAAPLPVSIREFVLGDSLQPKDTQKTLKRIRTGQERGFAELSAHLKFKDNFSVTYREAAPYLKKISAEARPYLKAALLNHAVTDRARVELAKSPPDVEKIADLMNRHHQVLRDDLHISTPKIERMIEKSLQAGARAAKINGSGEGGCMFAFCPGKQAEVAEAIGEAGGKPYIINIGPGLKVTKTG